MQTPSHVVVLASTNRPQSLSCQVADYYVELLSPYTCTAERITLTSLPSDFVFSALYAQQGKNSLFNQLRTVMERAEKYVFIVPEYNGSFPGVLKAFIDGLYFPSTFKHKKCAMVGLSKGPQGGALALSHLTDIFNYLGMYVHPLKIRVSDVHDSQLTTVLSNPHYVRLLKEQAQSLANF